MEMAAACPGGNILGPLFFPARRAGMDSFSFTNSNAHVYQGAGVVQLLRRAFDFVVCGVFWARCLWGYDHQLVRA